MQVDGVEDELPDELENACSDDSKMLKYTHTRTHRYTMQTDPTQAGFTQLSVCSNP